MYQQIISQTDYQQSLSLLKQAPFGQGAWKFWLVVLLVFANWGIEARKWQLLMMTLQPMSFLTAFKSVLCGVTVSLNTPNRIGEYGGRIIYVEEGNRLKAVSLSIAGSMSQLIITLILGAGGLFFVLWLLPDFNGMIFHLNAFWIKVLMYINAVGLALLLLFYFRLGWIVRMIEKLPGTGRFASYISVLDKFDAKILLRLLSLSASRYIVFVIQYIFMMQLLDVEAGWWQSFWILTVLFWVLAIIPSFAIAEIGIRGKFGIALIGLFSSNTTGIVAVMLSMWIFNLFIPAVTGGFLILGKKYFKKI